MNSKKLQTKFLSCKNNKDGKTSSTAVLTYYDYDDHDCVYDYLSYYSLDSFSFESAIKHIRTYKQLHNYYSMAYNELVDNVCKFVVKVSVRISDIPEVASLFEEQKIEYGKSIEDNILFDLKEILHFAADTDKEWVSIAMYPTSLTYSSGIISTVSEMDFTQPLLPIYMISEFTKIEDLDLGGFGNKVSGINSATFNFYPFFYNNELYIQTPGTGKMSNDGFSVTFAGYNSKNIEPVSSLIIKFAPVKDRFINNKAEFTNFNEFVKEMKDSTQAVDSKKVSPSFVFVSAIRKSAEDGIETDCTADINEKWFADIPEVNIKFLHRSN